MLYLSVIFHKTIHIRPKAFCNLKLVNLPKSVESFFREVLKRFKELHVLCVCSRAAIKSGQWKEAT